MLVDVEDLDDTETNSGLMFAVGFAAAEKQQLGWEL